MGTKLVATIVLAMLMGHPLPAQIMDVEIELAAVRVVLNRSHAGSLDVAINPRLVVEGTAPGVAAGLRDTAKTVALVRLLGVKALPRNEVISCVQRRCEMRGAGVYLSLSEPRVDGANATVTVTLDAVGRPGRLYYETIHLTLIREGQGWKVVKVEQLGIS